MKKGNDKNLGRSGWSGHLQIGLVSLPIKLYRAVSDRSNERVALNYLCHCGAKVAQEYRCEKHGRVEREMMKKGYQHKKDEYLVLEKEFLDSIKIETSEAIEIVRFIDRQNLGAFFLAVPYYVVPDAVGEEAYVLLREALIETCKTAIAKVVMNGREVALAMMPQDGGIVAYTLNTPTQVKDAAPYFEGLDHVPVNPAMLQIMKQIVDSRLSVSMDEEDFKDRYESALVEHIQDKLAGRQSKVIQLAEHKKVTDLMAALKGSLQPAGKERTRQKKSAAR